MGHRPDKTADLTGRFSVGGSCLRIWPALGAQTLVNQWVLKIELNGEWEECHFPSQQDALSAFLALNADYRLQRAILFNSCDSLRRMPVAPLPMPQSIN